MGRKCFETQGSDSSDSLRSQQLGSPQMSKFRFQILNHDNQPVGVTEWYDEPSRGAAPQKLLDVKAQYGWDLRYRIEREGLENKPNKQEYTRFKVIQKDTIAYSRLFQDAEAETVRQSIETLFPG